MDRDPRPRLRDRLRPNADNWLLWVLLPASAALWIIAPRSPRALLGLVDGATLSALAGLLALTKGVELSGVLQRLSRRLLTHVGSERQLALLLVSLSAALAAILTNDVSLFLIVPLTRSLASFAELPLARLVVCEALAVNAGSALTPIGNPQNLFLWQTSGIGFAHFVAMMVPAVAAMLLLLLALTAVLFHGRALTLQDREPSAAMRPRLLALSAGLFAVFVLLLDFHHNLPALALVLASYALIERRVLLRLDWTLLLIIALMFVALGQVAQLPSVAALLKSLPISHGGNAYLAGIVASQLISNVPATILLHHDIHDLTALAYGVNVGGFGLLIGSLANLIALRLAQQRGSFRLFHYLSTPFLLVAAALVGLRFWL